MHHHNCRRLLRVLTLCAMLIGLGGCSAMLFSEPVDYAGPEDAGFVPAGYMPPPGKCRIWYKHRPATQQPPPGSCEELRWRIPAGATLVYGS